MKELKELGFEFMPTRTEFDRKLITVYNDGFDLYGFISNKYMRMVNQPFKLGDFIPCIDDVPVDELIEKYDTIEQAINDGVKLKIK